MQSIPEKGFATDTRKVTQGPLMINNSNIYNSQKKQENNLKKYLDCRFYFDIATNELYPYVPNLLRRKAKVKLINKNQTKSNTIFPHGWVRRGRKKLAIFLTRFVTISI